jgi:hypothetical protein
MSDVPPISPDALTVPAGTPRWVTPELLADTLRVFRPYYGNLTSQDAVSIIVNVGNLFDALRDRKREEVPCPGAREFP